MSNFIADKFFSECTRENLAKAIPAPWDIYYDKGRWVIYDRKTQKDQIVIREHKNDEPGQIRATAHLVADAPELAAHMIELERERDEARQEAKKWRDKALYQRTVPALISPLPWEADHA